MDIHVHHSGIDGSQPPGIDTPYRTPQYAAYKAAPGDRILLLPSDKMYPGVSLHTSGVKGSPIEITSYEGAAMIKFVLIKDQNYIYAHDLIMPESDGVGNCVAIHRGSYNKLENLTGAGRYAGIHILDRSNHNEIINCDMSNCRYAGLALLFGSSYNKVIGGRYHHNGNMSNGYDRNGIASGASDIPTVGNEIIGTEIDHNGHETSWDNAISAYNCPSTVMQGLHIHHNYSSALGISKQSHLSTISDCTLYDNGESRVAYGGKGVQCLSVRDSSYVKIYNNNIYNNHVSPGSPHTTWETDTKGGIDIFGHDNTDMVILMGSNRVTGTIGGPNIHYSSRPNLTLLRL